MSRYLENSRPYTALPTAHTDSSSDFDTSFTEKDALALRGSPRRSRWKMLKTALQLFSNVVTILTFVLLAVYFGLHHGSISQQTGITGDGASRTLRMQSGSSKRVFGSDERYMSLDHKYDELWAPELAGHSAMVKLEQFAEDGRSPAASLAMIHQLHCLTYIRKALQQAAEGEDIGVDNNDNLHWPHCFYYLRQSILCAADGTLERSDRGKNGAFQFIDGADEVRQCGNPDFLYSFRDRELLISSSAYEHHHS